MLFLKKSGATLLVLLLSGCFGSESADTDSAKKLKSSLSQNVSVQHETVVLDKRLVLVETAGLLQKKISIVKLMEQYVEPKLVDLNTGLFIDDADRLAGYDAELSRTDPTQSVALTQADDHAGLKRRESVAKVFLIKNDHGKGAYDRVVLPVRAFGKFSMLHGYLALNLDDMTISGLGFYQHAETPGLGGNITDDPEWTQQFTGKQIFKHEKPDFQVVMNHSEISDAYSVDGISGATLTSQGVQNALNFWCGEQGFGPFLHNLKSLQHSHSG
ncbi:NADH:ubiquinone reductase (Na(+)-transporting) subunit C [Vibrio sp. HA2012]|uniref:NADH:ubiquinone reductase (Na(+)-transporting) subunit C n=1 Tax=Vibrio sp. HA2012 TaxID=1971595 RepID=UPI0012FD9E4A|nr:NADH:ubiquinone reductase (Na(+)-transporting) subunit C [Vibrio sp. HA2012]